MGRTILRSRQPFPIYFLPFPCSRDTVEPAKKMLCHVSPGTSLGAHTGQGGWKEGERKKDSCLFCRIHNVGFEAAGNRSRGDSDGMQGFVSDKLSVCGAQTTTLTRNGKRHMHAHTHPRASLPMLLQLIDSEGGGCWPCPMTVDQCCTLCG